MSCQAAAAVHCREPRAAWSALFQCGEGCGMASSGTSLRRLRIRWEILDDIPKAFLTLGCAPRL
ncbi:hypothetical protein Stube_03750 [Streptomyces tubercidicus]|uniref:Uncharacterized protein n=1 Tax=Streptomyces tubercidicus TaxID=47759 RepID=A0A640UK45_9ACTN|nr:hypothetical protein Stube_03750 [Streptomyces tubercidicus]